MRGQLRCALPLAGIVLLAATAIALGASPIKGAKYTGATVHDSEPIALKVSGSGRSVTVSVQFAPAYCQGGGGGTRQITKAATISSGGTFNGSIAYEFPPTHRIIAKLLFSGKFSGHTVKGTARSQFTLAPQCSGSTTFSAKSTATAAVATASKLHVTSRSWEIGQGGNLHQVAAGGTLDYCPTEPVTGLTPTIAYSHAPVGKSYTVKLAAPAASGSVPTGIKTKFAKASGHAGNTYATPSFPDHQIAPGSYTFSMLIGGKTVASLKLTLTPLSSKC